MSEHSFLFIIIIKETYPTSPHIPPPKCMLTNLLHTQMLMLCLHYCFTFEWQLPVAYPEKNISLLQEPSGTVNNIAGWLLGSYSPMAAWIGYRCCMVNALEVGCVVQVQQGIDQEGPCGSSRSLWKLSLRQGSSATDLWRTHGRSQPHPLYDKPFWCSLLHLCI